MRSYVLPAVVLASLSISSLAFASEPKCPSGAWFCSEEEVVIVDEAAPALPPPPPIRVAPRVFVQPAPAVAPPPVVVVITPGATEVVPQETQPAAPVCPPVTKVYPAKRPRHVKPRHVKHRTIHAKSLKARPTKATPNKWQPEGGFDLYLQRMSFGSVFQRDRGDDEQTMVGAGGALHVHATPKREFVIGNSFLYGKDFNGFNRSEVSLMLGVHRHFNPSGWFRPYLVAEGIVSGGSVYSNKSSPLLPGNNKPGLYYASYGALRGVAGVGLDLRVFKKVSFHLDLLAYGHWRFAATKDAAESIDLRSGETSNTFTGGMIRTGLTFWPG